MPSTERSVPGFILITEDDPGVCELESQRLEPLGLRVVRASRPEETIEILKSSSPELMLLDYSLPGMNALDLVDRLKRDAIAVPPFVIVTGRGDETVAVKAMKTGALDYLVKNASFLDNILPTVEKALEKATLQAKLLRAEKDLRRNLRLYNFLAYVNQTAAREKDRAALLKRVCEIAVETGGFKLAWVGEPDADMGRVLPLCHAGGPAEYLQSLRIDLNGSQYAAGPTGAALKERRITFSLDISTDPAMAPWREKALKAGFRSSAAIPLEIDGTLSAMLCLYSPEPSFFTPEELRLLSEVRADISLALEAIQSEERRAASQAALERTSGQLAHVMEATQVMLFQLRPGGDGHFVTEWVSGNMESLTGYDVGEILAPGWFEKVAFSGDIASVLAEKNTELFRTGRLEQTFRIRRKDGRTVWIQSQLKLASEGGREIIGSWTDITRLKESEERFQELFVKAPIGYQSLDGEGRLLAVNQTWCDIFGRRERDVLGANFRDLLAPASKAAFAGHFPAFREAGAEADAEFDALRPDGTTRRVSLKGRVAHNADGSFRQTHCVLTDVTDTWRSREQADLLSTALKASFNEIYIFDPDTFRFILVNDGAARNLGYSLAELEGMTPWDLKREFTEGSFRARVAPLLEGRSQRLIFESAHSRKDGTSYPVEVRLQLVETGKRRVFLAVVNDITERRKNEKLMNEMAAMQKVESLGQLAGGIAHDFNNMLTGILANISLLESRCGADRENAQILRETIEAARSAQALTSNLLAFSRGGKPVKKEFCLDRALADIFHLATRGTNCACEADIRPGLWSVEGDEGQLKQAVNNLLINALQAMPGGGRLTLRASNRGRDQSPPDGLEPGEYVRVSVSDTGVGIRPEDLPRVFDPYFTTKAKGHGIGLSMTWSVVKNHGGYITASSEPGKGSVFELYLPATGRRLDEPAAGKREAPKGYGRVLVLEDEEVVYNALRRMLTELGYECEVAQDGAAAVRLYLEEKAKGRPFRAVIMDLTIPGGMGGKEAVARLRESAPEARVIVSSGYSDEGVLSDFARYGFDAMLPKPYKFEDLAAALAALLKDGPR